MFKMEFMCKARQGQRESVLLPVKEYEELLEDLQDLALMAERKEEPAELLDVVKKRLEAQWRGGKSK